ncbi:MAG: copper chaperone PCu(A)C [Xanthobacteraceae bacterium]
MKPTVFLCVLLLLASAVGPLEVSAQEFKAGSLVISQPWSRNGRRRQSWRRLQMTITNIGTEPDRLIGGSLPQAGKFEVHEMRMENNVMTMRPLHGGLEINPGQTVKLAPGGYHVMFMQLKEPFKQGEVRKASWSSRKPERFQSSTRSARSPRERRPTPCQDIEATACSYRPRPREILALKPRCARPAAGHSLRNKARARATRRESCGARRSTTDRR